MPTDTDTFPKYDVPTAVIFFSAGLALGAMLSFVLSPLGEGSPVLHSTPDWMPVSAGRW
jgi:hypothetical protein